VQNCESGGYPITEAIMTINFPDWNIETMSNTSAVKTHKTEKTVITKLQYLTTELLNSQTDDRSTPTLLHDNSSPKILNPSSTLEYDRSTTHSTQNENTVRKGVSHVSRTQVIEVCLEIETGVHLRLKIDQQVNPSLTHLHRKRIKAITRICRGRYKFVLHYWI
jgi:hypothetical protein